jgi:diguanylate cyclase (GGDEF)-like protein
MQLSGPVSIAEGLWWVGDDLSTADLHCNPYLLIDRQSAILFEPGSVLDVEVVMAKVRMLVPLEKIEAIVVSHQDPDLCSAIPILEKEGFCGTLCCHSRAGNLIRFYGTRSPFFPVDQNNYRYRMKSGYELDFLPASYLHFPASIMTYLPKQKALVSGDLFGANGEHWSLYAGDDYEESMKNFHEFYMPSHQILSPVMERLLGMEIKYICPQHGSVIDNDCERYIRVLRTLRCGISSPHVDTERNREKIDYEALCNRVVKRYRALYGVRKLEKTFTGTGFVFDKEKKELTGFPQGDESIWDSFFDLVAGANGMGWITGIHPLVEKLCQHYGASLPRVFESILYQTQQDMEVMRERYRTLENSVKESKDRCLVTNLYNQDFFNRFLATRMESFDYEKNAFGLLFLTIDNLSRINLDFGRYEGDETLKTCADYLRRTFLDPDAFLFRLQGGLFAVFLAKDNREQAIERANRLCLSVSQSDSFIVPVTVSVGLFHTEYAELTRSFDSEQLGQVAVQTALFRLKLAERQGGNAVVAQSTQQSNGNGRISVLLVANENLEQELITGALQAKGYTVKAVQNGLDALEEIRKERPDIIVSELMTSKLSAFTLRKKLLKDSVCSRIPFILFSANKNEDTVSRAIGLGISHFFSSPVMLVELVGTVVLYGDEILRQEG